MRNKLPLDAILIKDYGISLSFSLLIALANFFIFKIVAHNFSENEFYLFSYSRRIISFLIPLFFLGIGVALPRFIARNDLHVSEQRGLLFVSLIVITVLPVIAIIVQLLFPHFVEKLLWSEYNHYLKKLSISIFFFVFSIQIGALMFSYYRGLLAVTKAYIVDIMNKAIIPIVLIFIVSDLIDFFFYSALILLVINLSVFFLEVRNFRYLKYQVGNLVGYGLRRVPGDISLNLFLLLPGFICAQLFSIEEAGIVSFGGTLINISLILVSPVSFITLSRSVKLLETDKSKLKTEMSYIVLFSVLYSGILLILGLFFLDDFITWYLGPEYIKHLSILKIFILALPGYIIFTTLRSIVDAAYKKAYNSVYSFYAILIFFFIILLSFVTGINLKLVVFSFVISIYFLAFFVSIKAYKVFK